MLHADQAAQDISYPCGMIYGCILTKKYDAHCETSTMHSTETTPRSDQSDPVAYPWASPRDPNARADVSVVHGLVD